MITKHILRGGDTMKWVIAGMKLGYHLSNELDCGQWDACPVE